MGIDNVWDDDIETDSVEKTKEAAEEELLESMNRHTELGDCVFEGETRAPLVSESPASQAKSSSQALSGFSVHGAGAFGVSRQSVRYSKPGSPDHPIHPMTQGRLTFTVSWMERIRHILAFQPSSSPP